MQADPINSKLQPPESKRLKLNCDALLSSSAFKFNLRRYTAACASTAAAATAAVAAVAGRCRLTLSDPC